MNANMLWYAKPAKKWMQGMPLGNGRLGAMVQGKLRNEDICLNDDTLWLKGHDNRNNPDALKFLPEMRRLLLCGEVEKATALGEAAMIGTPKKQSPYQVLGELNIIFTDHYDDTLELQDTELAGHSIGAQLKDYRRFLDISTAVAKVEYSFRGIVYSREHFVSGADGVFAVRITPCLI